MLSVFFKGLIQLFKNFQENKILNLLSSYTPKEIVPFDGKYSSNGVYIVSFNNSDIKGVFKRSDEYKKEELAYKVSKYFNFNFIPPTVIRSLEIDGKNYEGSLQLFIEKKEGLEEGWYENFLDSPLSKDMLFFSYLFGNWDVSPDNFLVDQNDKVWLIDNGCFMMEQKVQKYGTRPFVKCFRIYDSSHYLKEQDFPYNGADEIQGKGQQVYNELKSIFDDNLPDWYGEDYFLDLQNVIFKYVIYPDKDNEICLWRQFDPYMKDIYPQITEEEIDFYHEVLDEIHPLIDKFFPNQYDDIFNRLELI